MFFVILTELDGSIAGRKERKKRKFFFFFSYMLNTKDKNKTRN